MIPVYIGQSNHGQIFGGKTQPSRPPVEVPDDPVANIYKNLTWFKWFVPYNFHWDTTGLGLVNAHVSADGCGLEEFDGCLYT